MTNPQSTPDVFGDSSPHHDLRQRFDDLIAPQPPGYPNRQAFPGVFVDQHQGDFGFLAGLWGSLPVGRSRLQFAAASTTALLILDMTKNGACRTRPRCMATLPNIKRLYDAARAANVMLWYSLVGAGEPTGADIIDPGFAPRDGEWARQGGPDKFLGSNLEEKPKAGGVKTVVVCGTSFQGVGVGTGSEAAPHGYKVIIPIDCLSSKIPITSNTRPGICLRAGSRHQQFDADAQHNGEVR